MFGRFSEDARRALIMANRVATEAGHEYIGTPHIIIGILQNASATAWRALANLGLDVPAFRADVEQTVKEASDTASLESITPSSKAKRTVEEGLNAVIRMKDQEVDCEHLLLGLVQAEGLVTQLLSKHGITFEALDAEITRLRDADR